MQAAVRVVHFESLAQRVERVRLAGKHLARHQKAVGDLRDEARELRPRQPCEFLVEEADVEARVVDHDLGTGDELEQFVGHAREERLVGEEVVGQTVDLDGVFMVRPLRVQVAVQGAAREAAG